MYWLNNLSIIFYNLKSLDAEVGKFLGTAISKLPHLTNLKIDFNMLKKVGEKGVKNLCKILETCKNIESINFVFMGMGID